MREEAGRNRGRQTRGDWGSTRALGEELPHGRGGCCQVLTQAAGCWELSCHDPHRPPGTHELPEPAREGLTPERQPGSNQGTTDPGVTSVPKPPGPSPSPTEKWAHSSLFPSQKHLSHTRATKHLSHKPCQGNASEPPAKCSQLWGRALHRKGGVEQVSPLPTWKGSHPWGEALQQVHCSQPAGGEQEGETTSF